MTPLALAGVNFAERLLGGLAGRSQAKRERRRAQEAQRLAEANRLANNQIKAASANFQRYLSSEGNRRRGVQYERQRGAVVRNLMRTKLDQSSQNIMQQLGYARQHGAIAVQAASAGIGNRSIDHLNAVMAVQAAMTDRAQGIANVAQDFEVAEQLSQMQGNNILDTDLGYVDAGLDFMTTPLDSVAVPSASSILTGAIFSGIAGYATARGGK